jgi:hypothetical protein
MLEKVTKDVKELKADMAARSVTISSTPQLPIPPRVHTPPKIQSLCSLAWVPSPPVPASPMFPPGLQKPRQSLPPTTETTLSSPPQPKPDLGPFVHTTVTVTPKKAFSPHPPSLSTTGVVLFSLLLLHHRGSCHGPVVLQLVISQPSGNRPDPEPPPVVHHSTVLRSELDTSLVVCSHSFLYILLYFIFEFPTPLQSTIFNFSFLFFSSSFFYLVFQLKHTNTQTYSFKHTFFYFYTHLLSSYFLVIIHHYNNGRHRNIVASLRFGICDLIPTIHYYEAVATVIRHTHHSHP